MGVDVCWDRLIRFVAEDGNTYHGEPVFSSQSFDIGRYPFGPNSPMFAKVVHGNPLSESCVFSGESLQVQRLLCPLAPESVPAVRCIGGNYKTHLNELGVGAARFPTMFPKFPSCIIGPGETIVVPKIAQDDQADYEIELVVVMGQNAKHCSLENALDHVVGYTVGNDVSARKWQMDPELIGTHPPPQISFSKAFDTFCPIGPMIVSAKVIGDPHSLRLRTFVNGELRQNGNTSSMIFNIPQIIQFCSQGSTIASGSIILTGTPSGVGYAMDPPSFLRPGDKVEMEIENIGTLVNSVSYE